MLVVTVIMTALVAGAVAARWGGAVGALVGVAAFVGGRVSGIPPALRALLPPPVTESPDPTRLAVALCAGVGLALLGVAAARREPPP